MKSRLVSLFAVAASIALLAFSGGSASPIAVAQRPSAALGDSALGSSPVMFIENVGQWDDRAKFQVWGGPGGAMWLAEDGIWITVLEGRPRTEDERPEVDLGPPPFTDLPSSRQGANVHLSFINANPHPRIETFDRLDTTVSYFLGNDPDQWRPDVPVWGTVRYVDLWPGVDLEIGSQDGQLMQRFVVRDGADVSPARMKVEGADEVPLEQGWLVLSTEVRDVVLSLPQSEVAYTIEAVAADGQVDNLEVQPLDASSAVDAHSYAMPGDNPDDLLYSTFLGGGMNDNGHAIAVDRAGSAYVTGESWSNDFPTTPGAFDRSPNGGYLDAFVARINSAGSGLDYATFLGGSEADGARALEVDGVGRAYLAGDTESADFPTTAGSFDRSHGGGTCWDSGCGDAFVVRLSQSGDALQYSTFIGGDSADGASALAVDATGRAYVTGWSWWYSSDFPTTSGAFDRSLSGTGDAFVVRLNASGSALEYSTLLGGNDAFQDWGTEPVGERGLGIAVDDDRAWVVGTTRSPDFPTTEGAFDQSHNGLADAFVTCLNRNGSGLEYSTLLGGSERDGAVAVALDQLGRPHATGYTRSSNFPTTPGAFDTSFDSSSTHPSDGFVVKLNPTGSSLAYSTFLGGSASDCSDGIAVDGLGNAYVTGNTTSADFPTTRGAMDTSFDTSSTYPSDGFVVKLNPSGSGLAYATFLGGSSHESGADITADGTGSAYVTGYTASTNFPTTLGAFDTIHNGDIDAFVAKLAMGGTVLTPTPTPTATPSPTSTRTPTSTPTWTPTLIPGATATRRLPTPTATPDFPECTLTIDKVAYPEIARIDGQVGVTLRLEGNCPSEIGSALDVALVIDRSSSMCGAKLDQAQAAGDLFLQSMAFPPDQAAIISFASTAQLHTGLTGNRSQASNGLYSMLCGGFSRIDAGLQAALTEMSGPRRVAGHAPVIVLLTDGNPEGAYADDVRDAARNIHSTGIQLFTVGVGDDVNATLMREIATAPDHYYQSPSAEQLAQIYTRLAGELRQVPAANVNITDIVGTQFEVVPFSFSGAAIPQVNGNTLNWYLPRLDAGGTEVSFSVKPKECGTFAVNQAAQVSYDDNRGVRHTRSFSIPTVTIEGCGGDLTDAFMRDNGSDTGTIPSTRPWWTSPDIWVRRADDGIIQYQNPQAGQRNFIYARIWNRGTTTVHDIDVSFCFGSPNLGLSWPDGWNPLSPTRRIASLDPGQHAIVSIPWDVPNLGGHFCLMVRITAPDDPIRHLHIHWENNVAQRNAHIIDYPQPSAGNCELDDNGQQTDRIAFDVMNTLNTSTLADLEITISRLPTGSEVRFEPGALAGRWTSLDGLVQEADGRLLVTRFPAMIYGLRLNPNELRTVHVEVTAPGNSRFTVGLTELVRGVVVGGNTYQRYLPPCPLYLPVITKPVGACPPDRTYTVDADFDEGLLISVNHDPPHNDQLQLDSGGTPLPFIWIALSGRGTVAKVNTETGEVLGEYRSAPSGRSRNPSRTTVDLNGNVWVGNRDEDSGGKGSVVRIGLLENHQCVDRNGNAVIDTSTGLGDVKAWTNPGGVDNNGGVSSAEDECIIDYLRVNGTNVRTLAVDAQNNVWIGGLGNLVHDLVDSSSMATLRTITPACGGYGGLIDSNGVLWSARGGSKLLRYDPALDAGQCISISESYGLAVDSHGVVWNSQWVNHTITRLDPSGAILGTVATGGHDSRGVTVTNDDHIWIANSSSNTVTRLNNNGTLLATISVGSTPTGVAVDAAGKVWVTNYASDNAMRIDPATNAVDLTVYLGSGAAPYNYSDMTGSVILGALRQGKWIVAHDSTTAGTGWGTVTWRSHEPAGTGLSVQVRSAEDPADLGSRPWVRVQNGVVFTTVPDGRYLQIEVQFTGTDEGSSPILYDLTVAPRCDSPWALGDR